MTVVMILVVLAVLAALRVPIVVAMLLAGIVAIASVLHTSIWPLFVASVGTPLGGLAIPTFFMVFLITGLVRARFGSRAIFVGLRSFSQPGAGGAGVLAVLAFGLGAAMGDSMDRRSAQSLRDAMRAAGYSEARAMGALLAAASFRYVVPISVSVVFLGYLTEQSISKTMIALILPVLLLWGLVLATAGLAEIAKRAPSQSQAAEPRAPGDTRLVVAVVGIVVALIVVVLVTEMIGAGLTTPLETFAIVAFLALVVAVIVTLIEGAPWRDLLGAFTFSARKTGEIALLFIAATMISRGLTFGGFVTSLGEAAAIPTVLLVTSLVCVTLLAAVFGALPGLALVTPIAWPLILAVGFDPSWWACVMLAAAALGQTLPYIGRTNRFLAQCFPEVSAGTLFRGALPYAAALLIWLLILILEPPIVLSLPKAIGL